MRFGSECRETRCKKIDDDNKKLQYSNNQPSSTQDMKLLLLLALLAPSTAVNYGGSTANPSNDHAAMLGRIEASITGESALIDRETGRVFWEGGSSTTRWESLVPRLLDQYGVDHFKAAFLTGLLTLAIFGVISSCMRQLKESNPDPASQPIIISFVWTLLEWTILRFPKIENKWLVLITIILYLLESYNCSTRRFLANAISSPSGVEEYIEQMRKEPPVVTWKVQTFHYERRSLLPLHKMCRRFFNKNSSAEEILAPKNSPPIFLFTKRVISHSATATYEFKRYDVRVYVGL
jgi:hypothetical protein